MKNLTGCNHEHPVHQLGALLRSPYSPRFHDRVADGERKAIARLNQAIAEFNKKMGFREEPK